MKRRTASAPRFAAERAGPATIHPRPQLRRESWLELSGTWQFAYDDGDVGVRDGWAERPDCFDRQITVPFPPESVASGIGDRSEHPVVWYRRIFLLGEVPGMGRGSTLLLHFGAVDYEASVWVNGVPVGRHQGGHSSFSLDVTQALVPGEEQAIVVRAEDRPRDLTQPRGKQTWEQEPRRIWYHRTTGIWQPVWLEAVGATHVAELRWTPDTPRGRLGVDVRLNREPDAGVALRLRLSIHGDLLADDRYVVMRQESRRDIGLQPGSNAAVRAALLWSPTTPNLLDAELVLEDARGETLDAVQSYVGLRSMEATDGLFLLNGRPSYLRFVLAQNYWPESHLAAPSADELRREAELVKALGFNGVRIHQKVEDPRFLYWCDRIGLFVWAEMANAYVFSPEAIERFTREWLDVVRRDYSHPSIVTWVPFNESWGVPNLPGDPAQRDFVRAM
jgi:beta-galactosidase/beta-glucuronidase